MEDLVVIPLRVSREQRRAWRDIAIKEDKSVQRWILDKLNPVRGADPTKVLASSIEPQGRTGGATPPTGAKRKVELPANPAPEPLAEKKVEEVAIKPTRWCGVCARLVDSWKMKDGLAICERHWKDLE